MANAEQSTVGNLTGQLTLETAASELGTTPLGIKRLIARGRLAATTLGKDDRRITASAIAAYVALGAKDFTLPPIGGDWFADPEKRLGEGFSGAMCRAFEALPLDHDQLRAAIISTYGPLEKLPVGASCRISVTVAKAGAISELVNSPPPKPIGAIPSDIRESIYRSWAEIYLVSRARTIARQVIGRKPSATPATAIERLYASPEGYSAIRDEAMARLQNSKIASSSMVMVEGERPPAAPGTVVQEGKKVSAIVTFEFPAADLTNNFGRIAALAF